MPCTHTSYEQFFCSCHTTVSDFTQQYETKDSKLDRKAGMPVNKITVSSTVRNAAMLVLHKKKEELKMDK